MFDFKRKTFPCICIPAGTDRFFLRLIGIPCVRVASLRLGNVYCVDQLLK